MFLRPFPTSRLCKTLRLVTNGRRLSMARRWKRHVGNAQLRGEEGESYIFEQSMRYLQMVQRMENSDAMLYRVADYPYMGDFEWVEQQKRIHIEVKNVRKMGEKPMKRFERDVMKGMASGRIDGAMCINVEWVDCLPGGHDHQDIYLATIQKDSDATEGFPVLLVRNVKEDPSLLFGSLDMMRRAILVKTYPSM